MTCTPNHLLIELGVSRRKEGREIMTRRKAITDEQAVPLLIDCLTALRNLAPRSVSDRQRLCFGEIPRKEDCNCTACKILRLLNQTA